MNLQRLYIQIFFFQDVLILVGFFFSNTCIKNKIHAEIRSIPPIGVIMPTLIFANDNRYKEPENKNMPIIVFKMDIFANVPVSLLYSIPKIKRNRAWYI